MKLKNLIQTSNLLLLVLSLAGCAWPAKAADITPGYIFSPGEQNITDVKLNTATAGSVNTSLFTSKSAKTALASVDLFLIYDPSAAAFRKVTLSSLIGSAPSTTDRTFTNITVYGTAVIGTSAAAFTPASGSISLNGGETSGANSVTIGGGSTEYESTIAIGGPTAGVGEIAIGGAASKTNIVFGSRVQVGNQLLFSGPTAGTTIPVSGSFIRSNGSGTVTMTATPTLQTTGVQDGTILYYYSSNGTTVFQDNGTLPGSDVELQAATRSVGPGDVLQLIFSDGKWWEVSFANN